ncbi:PorP/SprF family type IX secretion system membrane protein [Flavobacterium macacae]|uniref:Type IX secretion system membrane protein PorP/SprF n=1 Tax=Flavobacterium macacae TaxID=2488993 RepID=A0A3P3WF55_9FLAO|nr:PorP/SprF family type IX secretion system membrane protein [Flavobacterium macacae]RRJ93048.1 type IX secretion system membrane protein PorP/SprF [Flavobacterium macacae]
MKSKIIIVFLLLFTIESKAQDPIFTQFYLVPETLNPAFTGIANTWNAGIVHRRQWPDGNRKMDTQYAYANTVVSDEIGLGMTVQNHNEDFTNYNYFNLNAALSYRVDINYDWRLRLGLEAGAGRKDFGFKNLLLEDQINGNSGAISPTSVDPNIGEYGDKINFFDVSAGFTVDQEFAWFGVAVKHLNRPNISFTENGNTPLDMFLSLHGGYYFQFLNSPSNLIPQESTLLVTANYMRQGQYNRLDLGTVMDFGQLGFGVIVATNPEGKSANSHFVSSVNPVTTFKLNEFTLGYSYDWNVSKLGRTQGVHELKLIWQSSRRCDKCKYYSTKLKRNGGPGYNKI